MVGCAPAGDTVGAPSIPDGLEGAGWQRSLPWCLPNSAMAAVAARSICPSGGAAIFAWWHFLRKSGQAWTGARVGGGRHAPSDPLSPGDPGGSARNGGAFRRGYVRLA